MLLALTLLSALPSTAGSGSGSAVDGDARTFSWPLASKPSDVPSTGTLRAYGTTLKRCRGYVFARPVLDSLRRHLAVLPS
jgi:hypothetical protein